MQQLSWIITLELVLLSGGLVKGQSCNDFALGISNPEIIPSTRMNASSFLSFQTRPYHARFGQTEGDGWCAKTLPVTGDNDGINTGGEYLEIDLGNEYVFCGVKVGAGDHGLVKSYTLEFSRDGHSGTFNRLSKIFSRHSTEEQVSEFDFFGPFPHGRFVRFIPVKYAPLMCARIELYGFPGPKVTCRPQEFIAEFKRNNYPDLKANEMHLTDKNCTETNQEDNSLIVFNIPFRGCGTVRNTSPKYLEYSNTISRRITEGIISFKMDLTFSVSCKYDRNVTVDGVDFEVKENETTTSGAVARVQGRFRDNWYLWLVSLWLPGAVLYWVSIADLWTFERRKLC